MQALLGFIISILVDTSFSWARMLVALFLSILVSLFVGIYAATNRTAERLVVPVLDIFQTLPILAFFPFVIFVVVAVVPGFVGINVAVVFLIITSMVWNITFGVYESIKTMPLEFFEVGRIFHLSSFDRLTKVLIPASMPRVVEQSILSWSIGLFYLVTSEIFSTGNAIYTVKHGIGVALTHLALSGNYLEYLIGIIVFVCFVIATRLLLFDYLKKRFTRHTLQEVYRFREERKSNIIKALDRISPFNKARLEIVRKNMVGVRNRLSKPLDLEARHATKRGVRKTGARDMSAYKRVVYVAIVVAAALFLYTYRGFMPTYLGYEYTVLLSLAATIVRIWLAFAVILAISLPVGVYLVFMTKKSNAYLLAFQIIASIPATIILPIIAISMRNLPYHSEFIAFIIFLLSGVWYMIFSIVSNRSTIPSSVYEVKSIFNVRGRKAWSSIYVKAILPGLITGAITGLAAEWNASIVAERFTTSVVGAGTVISSVNLGLGRLLDVALSNGNIGLMILGLINLTIVIVLVNRLVWKKLYKKTLSPYR